MPTDVTDPGERVSIHVPAAGKPFNIMLPVDKEHVGGIINPATGAEGITGGAGTTTFPDAGDMQPEEFVTVKV